MPSTNVFLLPSPLHSSLFQLSSSRQGDSLAILRSFWDACGVALGVSPCGRAGLSPAQGGCTGMGPDAPVTAPVPRGRCSAPLGVAPDGLNSSSPRCCLRMVQKSESGQKHSCLLCWLHSSPSHSLKSGPRLSNKALSTGVVGLQAPVDLAQSCPFWAHHGGLSPSLRLWATLSSLWSTGP